LKQDWEVAYVYNRNHLQGTVTGGYFSQVEFAKAVAASNDYNPFSVVQSAAFNASIIPANFTGPTLAGSSESNTIDAKISGDIWQLPAGAMQYALGYQWADASLTTNPSPALFTGDIAGLGGATAPVDKSRTLNAFWGELAIPVIKSLDLNLQGRYDDYNDVGNKFTYYWSQLDAEKIAGLFTGNGDIRHPDGSIERGPQVILSNRTQLFMRKEYHGSKHPVQLTDVRCLDVNDAIADGKWELRLPEDPQTALGRGLSLVKTNAGLCTLILVKAGDTWLIEAWRYTINPPAGAPPPTLLSKPGYIGRGGGQSD